MQRFVARKLELNLFLGGVSERVCPSMLSKTGSIALLIIEPGQEDNERFLKLEIHDAIPNLSGMLEYLKKVVIFVKLL